MSKLGRFLGGLVGRKTEAGAAVTASEAPAGATSDAPAAWKVSLPELRRIIADADELSKGTRLFDERGLAHLARYQNRLYAEAKGSGSAPYKVSLRFEAPSTVRPRCKCFAARSRPFCKHAAALLVAWSRDPSAFVVSESAPAETADGAGKKRAVKRGSTSSQELMAQGVAQVSTLVRELAVAGVATLGGERVEQLRLLAQALRENRLRRLSARTHELADLVGAGATKLDSSRYTELLADMLLAARRIEKHLAGEALEDRHVEELVGKTWRKTDRRPVAGLELVEYGYQSYRTSDDFLIRESRFFDVATGVHYSEKLILPAALVKRTEPKPSHAGVLLSQVTAGAYPGFAPLRLDLEESGSRKPLDTTALEALAARAVGDIGQALASFQEHRKDIFAPERLPIAVRVDTILSANGRLHAVDAAGNALFLPDGGVFEERLGGALRDARLVALLGDIDLDGALPTLHPLAALVGTGAGLELRGLATGELGARPTGAHVERSQAAQKAGASSAGVSLAEVREELCDAMVQGLTGFGARTAEPLIVRLRGLGLEKQAVLLAGIVDKADPAERLDDFVKLYHVLGIALVRLVGATHVDRATLERVPGFESVCVPRPAEIMPPREVARRRLEGTIGRYEAALHYARHYAALSADELAAGIYPTWADGSAAPYVAKALAAHGAAAVAAAEKALVARTGRVARVTAIQVLSAVRTDATIARLKKLASSEQDPLLRVLSREAIEARDAGQGGGSKSEAVAAAQTGLGAARKEDREEAVRRLEQLGSPMAIPALRQVYFSDPTLDVRAAAARALGRLCDHEMVEHFGAVLAGRDGHDEDAKYAAYALGDIGDVRGLAPLFAAFVAGFKPGVIAEALRAFGPAALEPLIELAEATPELAERKAAQSIVAALPDPEVAAVFCERLRRIAAEADFSRRAMLYLKLTADVQLARVALARELLTLAEQQPGCVEKAVVTAAKRIASAAKSKQAQAEPT